MSSEGRAQVHRSIAKRVGLVVLNIIAPGLGLVRLGRPAEGATYLFGLVAIIVLLFGIAWVLPVISPSIYLVMLVVLLLATAFVYLASAIRVWRVSRFAEPMSRFFQRWYGLVGIYALSSLVSFGAVSFAQTTYKSYFLPSASMEPTFAVGDQLVADMRGSWKLGRGDLVVVKVGDSDYIKRIVAIGGDRIKLVKGVPYIDGAPAGQHIVDSYVSKDTRAVRLTERLPGELRFHEILDSGPTELDGYSERTVPEGQFFLLGDNRDNSADSRVSKDLGGIGGMAQYEDIRGKALFTTFDSNYHWIGKVLP